MVLACRTQVVRLFEAFVYPPRLPLPSRLLSFFILIWAVRAVLHTWALATEEGMHLHDGEHEEERCYLTS